MGCKCNCGCGDKHGHQGGTCGCHEGPQFGRWLWTKAEKIDWLEDQSANLQAQVKTYEERIAALKAE
mgnify:CR=1 FL=1|jgi:hypothetical protein